MTIWALEHLMLGLVENVKDAYNIIINESNSYKIKFLLFFRKNSSKVFCPHLLI